jgi:putative mycofactocin binding protein MftB
VVTQTPPPGTSADPGTVVAPARHADGDPTVHAFDLDAGWRLAPLVAIRREPFGALLYHAGTRRLSFLTSTALREVVESLADHDTARSAAAAAGVADPVPSAVVSALARLVETGMITRRRSP